MFRKILFTILLLAAASLAYDVTFVCDDGGGASSFNTIPQAICDPMSESFTYIMYNDNRDEGLLTSNPAWWANQRLVIWYASGTTGFGRLLTTAELNAANDFLANGGWLLVTGYDMLGNPDDPLMADLVRSTVYGCYHSSNDLTFTITNPDHFLVDGPYGTFNGTLSFTENLADEMIPDSSQGCVEVIDIDQTYDSKVIDCAVGSGRITTWNGNETSTNWQDADCANMVRNWIAEGLAPAAIEETTWGQLKASFSK